MLRRSTVWSDRRDRRTHRRTRFHDAATGRFTQKDPIGLAGGLNQYSYAAADPIGNSDPTGLTVCFDGATPADGRALQQEYERATGTTVTEKDSNGCAIDAVRTSGTSVSEEISNAFIALARSSHVYWTRFGTRPNAGPGEPGSGGYGPNTKYVFYIDTMDIGRGYGIIPDIMGYGTCHHPKGSGANFTLSQIIVHEMGHMYDYETSGSSAANPNANFWAMRLEYLNATAAGQPFRGHACHER